jgi:hypothetical protein
VSKRAEKRTGASEATVTPLRAPVVTRKFGRMRDRIRVAADFEAPLPEHLFNDKE